MKRDRNRILSLLLAVLLVFSTLPALTLPVSAATVVQSGSCGTNVNFVLDSDGTLTISGSGAMTNYSSGTSVPWYSNRSKIKTVVIGDSVTSIGGHAFYECSSLTSVTIPDSVTSIGSTAFADCTSLTSVTIPDSVTSIGNDAFSFCSSLTSVTIPDSVTSIGRGAFFDCSSLTSVTIPDSVTSIGGDAFYYCTSLTSVTIGTGVTSISSSAFHDCSSLTSVTIPDSVTSIGRGAFSDCTALTSVTIPDSVTSIGHSAFRGCSNLTDIYCEASSQPSGWDSSWKSGCSATVHWNYGTPIVPPLTATWVVEGETVYTATFTEGEEEPTYAGETPKKEDDSYASYTFSGWSRSVDADGNVTYTAEFTASPFGDISGDGLLSISDVTILLVFIQTDSYSAAADANCDGLLSIADVTTLLGRIQ